MDLTALKAMAYDKIRELERVNAELKNLNHLIVQTEQAQQSPPAAGARKKK